MAVAISAPRTNLEPWTEGLKAKQSGQGKKFGKTEFDKLLGNYDSLLDIPAQCFTEELVEAYPDAKVILHTRDIDAWCRSIDDTVGRAIRWHWRWIALWDPEMAKPWYENLTATMPVWMNMTIDDVNFYSPAARESFKKQYELVRRIVPKDRLLEYKVQDGWQPLCDFLDLPVPDEEFPKSNDSDEFIAAHKAMWWKAFNNLVRTLTVTVAIPMLGVALAVWWQFKRRE